MPPHFVIGFGGWLVSVAGRRVLQQQPANCLQQKVCVLLFLIVARLTDSELCRLQLLSTFLSAQKENADAMSTIEGKEETLRASLNEKAWDIAASVLEVSQGP